MMKTKLLTASIMLLLMIFTLPLFAEVADYNFVQTVGTYTEITGGFSLGTETSDDQRFVDPATLIGGTVTTGPGFPIGFNFVFNDYVFDVIAINTNGWISLGQTSLGAIAVNNASTSAYIPLSSVVAITPDILYHRIAGFGRDLQAQTGASLRMETIGTAPNRTCIIQWKDYKRYSTTGTGDIINFQIQLHETTNKVAIRYGVCTAGTTTSSTVQAGMRGAVPTDFIARESTTDWTLTNAGTVNTAAITFVQGINPPNGLTFEFLPLIPAPNDLQALTVTGSATPSVGAASNYTVRVRNRGTLSQSIYSVKLMLGDTEIASVPGTTIAPLEILEFSIPWTPSATGPAALTGKVVLAGDANPLNDISAPLNVNVYPAGTLMVVIGTGRSAQRYPMGSLYGYERSAAIYTAAELGTPGLISGIMWEMAAQYGNVVPYRILMKTTTATALVAQPWATTITDAVLCAEGSVTFNQLGWVYFPFTTPYFYAGDNLMVLVETNYGGPGTTSSQTFYYTTSTTASHHYMYADTTPPSTNGYVSASRPNVGISFQTTNMGSLNGLVTSGGLPLEGATISVLTTTLNQLTNTVGTYNFPYVMPGTYQISCSKIGYETQTLPAVITAGQTTTLNFAMVSSTSVNVTGTVVGSDAPTVGLADATVNITGIMNYTGTTNASGQFTIPGVLSGNNYTYSVARLGYQGASGNISVGTVDYSMGTITLSEIATPPSSVTAELNANHTEATVTWRAPGAASPYYQEDFETTNGGWVPSSNWTNPLGDWEWTNTYDVTNFVHGGYATSEVPPTTAHSGTGLWGTIINAPYTNSGGFSYLTHNFDFTGYTNSQFRFWSWQNLFGNFDYAQVKVNGTIVWGPTTAVNNLWQEVILDLSAYDGNPNVVIQLEAYATTVVNYAGWYVDDFYVGPASGYVVTLGKSRNPITELTHTNSNFDRSLIGFKVWRLLQGQETNEAAWTLLTTTAITDTFYVNANWQSLPDGEYKYAVKAVYTGDVMSVPMISNMLLKHAVVNVTGTVVGSDAPTVGLAGAEIAITGMADYNATTNAQGLFTIPGVYNLETYNYTITKTGYQSVSGTINVGLGDLNMGTITMLELALPAAGVQAVEALPNVNITWMEPGTGGGEWIQWDSDTNTNSIGMTNGGAFDVASRWPASDLTDYVGQSLYAIKFWPGDAGTYRIRVWTGGDATAPAQMVVDEAYTTYTIDAFNTVNLSTPVPIQAGQELWFGYNVVHAAGVYPAGCDAGPAHNGTGNMIYTNSAWTTLYALSASLNYDWNIAGYIGYSAPTRLAPLTPIPFGYDNGNTGKFVARKTERRSQNAPAQVTTQDLRSLQGYKVWRLIQGQELNEAAWTALTPNPITATAYSDTGWDTVTDGMYKWAVKAVYSGGVYAVPAFSNAIQKLTQIGTIAGIVRGPNNVAINGATITAGTFTATSNATGAYSMQVPAGTYTVTCTADGYTTGTQTGIVVVTGQTTQANFNLAVSTLIVDGFESYTDFAIDFAPWVNVDIDQSATYGYNGFDFPGEYGAMAFMVYNPSTTVPASTTQIGAPHGGNKMAHCWAATTPPNNDWLISQLLINIGVGAEVSFWARSLTDEYGLERFKVGISTGGTAPTNFTYLTGASYVQAPVDWTLFTYQIPELYVGHNARIGIHCVSNDAFIFMVDDFTMSFGFQSAQDPVPPVYITALHGNYPNPFNPNTTISYSVKGTQPVVVEIFNTKGQKVKTLVNETKAEGNHKIAWDGTDDNNVKVSSGVYFYKMNAGKYSSSKKMILMK
jgi:hypothetical protein